MVSVMVSVVVPRAGHGSRAPVIDVQLLGRFVVAGQGRDHPGCRTRPAVWPSSRSPPLTSPSGKQKRWWTWPDKHLSRRNLSLPDELEAAIRSACKAWDGDEPEKAGRLVGRRGETGPRASVRLKQILALINGLHPT